MKLLLVEDEAPKQENLRQLLIAIVGPDNVKLAKSVRSAIDFLRSDTADLIILDMSLPTFDIGAEESGGRPQGFGGIEVMRFLDRLKQDSPVIVVTAFEAFAEKNRTVDLEELAIQLRTQHSRNFRGLVYYNTVIGTWHAELTDAVNKVLENFNK